MTITKTQWDKIDELFPEDGTDWDGVSEPTVLIILQLMKMISDIKAAYMQWHKEFKTEDLIQKISDTIGEKK